MSLYRWEGEAYQNDDQVRQGHILDNVTIKSIEDIWRARLLRFFLVNMDGDARDLFLPLHEMRPADANMVETIRHGFFAPQRCVSSGVSHCSLKAFRRPMLGRV